jgi:signal transduction histidine kinase
MTRKRATTALIALVAVVAVVEIVLGRHAANAPRTTLWFTVPAVALVVLPLLGYRRFPFGAPALLWCFVVALSFVDGRLVTYSKGVFLAGLAASFLLGHLRDARHQRIGLAIVLGSVGTVVYNDPAHSTGELVFIPLMFALAWLVGVALRERAEQTQAAEARAAQAERERELAARVAVAEERARIARELHDVVAHAVSVMVLQVGAVRHRLPDPLTEDRDALRDVEQAGRTALVEMRRLLGAMRNGSDALELTPQPGLDSLQPLLDDIRRSGLPVDLRVEGAAVPLPRALDLSAYRIVQEGLTNALKHAQASHAVVFVRYRPDELEIEVRDDGRGSSPTDGRGHGLIGVQERVSLYGGRMSAAAANGGGFVLTTHLPLDGATR